MQNHNRDGRTEEILKKLPLAWNDSLQLSFRCSFLLKEHFLFRNSSPRNLPWHAVMNVIWSIKKEKIRKKFSKDTLVFPHTILYNTGTTTLEEYFCPFLDLNTTYSSCPRTPNTKWQKIRPWLHAMVGSLLEHVGRNPFSASLPTSAWHALLREPLDHCFLAVCGAQSPNSPSNTWLC